MSGLTAEIVTLNDREPVPQGSVTFGQLILESLERFEVTRVVAKEEKHHLDLYVRWCRRYRTALAADDPIFTDRRLWEWYVCRFMSFGTDCVPWFMGLDDAGRRSLCIISRDSRRLG